MLNRFLSLQLHFFAVLAALGLLQWLFDGMDQGEPAVESSLPLGFDQGDIVCRMVRESGQMHLLENRLDWCARR